MKGRVMVTMATAFALGLAGCSAQGPEPTADPDPAPPTVDPEPAPDPAPPTVVSTTVLDERLGIEVPTADEVLGQAGWGNLLESLGEDAVAAGLRVTEDLPVTGYVQWQGEGGGEAVEFDDPGVIRALFNAVAASSIGGETNEVWTDDYTYVWFVFADDTRLSVSIDAGAVDLPGDDSYAMYELLPSDDLATFMYVARMWTMGSY